MPSEVYHFIYITNLPSFYKINLFNKIAETRNILVIFTRQNSKDRNDDFYKGERKFKYVSIGHLGGIFKAIKLISLLWSARYNQLIIGGLDSIELWAAAFLCPAKKNAIVIESSIFESPTTGLKGFLKRAFFRRLTTAYVSGKAQKELAIALGFKGIMKITKGVGIFNISDPPEFQEKKEIKNFIYVGRLSEEKNLTQLILTFNELPALQLHVAGFGPEEKKLKSMANRNVIFHGAVNNTDLPAIYRSNDVFILPSKSEPWGLVVEEALNNGLPVIVSNMVGCSSEIIDQDQNGIIFNLQENNGLKNAILKMTETSYYNSLRQNVCRMDFKVIVEEQVNCYL